MVCALVLAWSLVRDSTVTVTPNTNITTYPVAYMPQIAVLRSRNFPSHARFRSVLHSDYAHALSWNGVRDLVTGGWDSKLHVVQVGDN